MVTLRGQEVDQGYTLTPVTHFLWENVLSNYYGYLNSRWFRFHSHTKQTQSRVLKEQRCEEDLR